MEIDTHTLIMVHFLPVATYDHICLFFHISLYFKPRGVTIGVFVPKFCGFAFYFFIEYFTLDGNKSWTLCFYPQLYLMSFYLCKAFVRYNLLNQIKIKLFNKNNNFKTAVPKTIPNRDLKTEVRTES